MASLTVTMPSLGSIRNWPLLEISRGKVPFKASQRSPPISLVIEEVLPPLVELKLLVPLSPPGKVLM